MPLPPRPVGRGLAVSLAALAILATAWLAADAWLERPPPHALVASLSFSVVVEDRDGQLLRPFTTPDGRWRLPVALEEVDARFLAMLEAYEDRRFHDHPGIDVLAVARAGLQAARHGRIVSGASTITMQTVRLSSGDRRRTLDRKLAEMAQALRLERHLDKRAILERYLALAPYGGNLEGIRAASLAWFGKEPRRLTMAEAALLIALPQAPEARRPDRHPEAARIARNRVLARLAARGAIDAEEAAAARARPVPTARRPFPLHAPHLARRVRAARPDRLVHRLAIRRDLQARLETRVRDHASRIDPAVSAAAIVTDHRTGEILAHVGSADFLSVRRGGHLDMTEALRSPGSALKPFIYGLAFELGIARPMSLIEDAPVQFGPYAPENLDDAFHGEVTVSEALQRSLNVPAVTLLEAIGPVRLVVRMREAGARPRLPASEMPGLAIGLGGLGITLRDLATLYAGIARGGEVVRLQEHPGTPEAPVRLIAGEAARHVTAILRETPPPLRSPRNQIAYKTGTSYGHRDALAIGYDGSHVVGVWIGRPDGAPVPQLTGWSDAAPLLFATFPLIAPRPTRFPPLPVARPTADLPPSLQRVARLPNGRPGHGRQDGPRIAFPVDGAIVELSFPGDGMASLPVRAAGHASALTWLIDSRPIVAPAHRRVATLPVGRPGSVVVSLLSADGRSDTVRVTIQPSR